MAQITRQQLKSYLWESANILRGKIDSGDFKHYILGLLFYKRLSDVFDDEFEKLKEQVGEELALDSSLYADVFFIPAGCHWNDILSTSTNIGAKINDVFADTTIDNNHTTGEVRILLEAYKNTNNIDYLVAAVKGVEYLFTAQYANGGWPQYYPLRNNYSRHITFNDNAMYNVMMLMKDIYTTQANTQYFPEAFQETAKNSFYKGIEVIVNTQNLIDGIRTAWCAQHHASTF